DGVRRDRGGPTGGRARRAGGARARRGERRALGVDRTGRRARAARGAARAARRRGRAGHGGPRGGPAGPARHGPAPRERLARARGGRVRTDLFLALRFLREGCSQTLLIAFGVTLGSAVVIFLTGL